MLQGAAHLFRPFTILAGAGSIISELTAGDWFVLARHELFLFAATFFLIGALDELAVDLTYAWLRLSGRVRTPRVDEAEWRGRPLAGRCAVFIPAWKEHRVIATTVNHALAAWPQEELHIYVGCYRGDAETHAAVANGCSDPRVRIVVHEIPGPTCKADCLNRLYRALEADEWSDGAATRMVVLHDAEDMVDPAALALLDSALDHADFVQLPVVAMPHPASPLVSGHYSDEFAEAHAKSMVVRSALGQGIPGAGVGCAIRREWLSRFDLERNHLGPFATGALTEDYELGLQSAALGARGKFLRVRTTDGRLIATRAYFPCTMRAAIRQKARWIHGIAFQAWDRFGWHGPASALWMQARDRRGPLAALLLALAYFLVVLVGIELVLNYAGWIIAPLPRTVQLLLWINMAVLAWRLGLRSLFTAREFGLLQGLLAIPRVVVSNTVAIVAARRAAFAYVRSLRGSPPAWDKTDHTYHPAHAAAIQDRIS